MKRIECPASQPSNLTLVAHKDLQRRPVGTDPDLEHEIIRCPPRHPDPPAMNTGQMVDEAQEGQVPQIVRTPLGHKPDVVTRPGPACATGKLAGEPVANRYRISVQQLLDPKR